MASSRSISVRSVGTVSMRRTTDRGSGSARPSVCSCDIRVHMVCIAVMSAFLEGFAGNYFAPRPVSERAEAPPPVDRCAAVMAVTELAASPS